jgi:hypothetical protein
MYNDYIQMDLNMATMRTVFTLAATYVRNY